MMHGGHKNLNKLFFLSCLLFFIPSISNADTSNSTRIEFSVVIQGDAPCLYQFSATNELASRNYSRIDSLTCNRGSANANNNMTANVDTQRIQNSDSNFTRLVSVVQ